MILFKIFGPVKTPFYNTYFALVVELFISYLTPHLDCILNDNYSTEILLKSGKSLILQKTLGTMEKLQFCTVHTYKKKK